MRNKFLKTFWERFKIPDGWRQNQLRGPDKLIHWRYAEHLFIRGSFSGVLRCHTCRERGLEYCSWKKVALLNLASIAGLVLKWSAGVSVSCLWLRPLLRLGRRGRRTDLGSGHFLWLRQRRRGQLLTRVEVGYDVALGDRVEAGAGAVGGV